MLEPSPANALLARWRITLERRGSAPAVLSARGETLRTFEDLQAESISFEEHFAGLPGRSVVALQIGNDDRWPAALLALARLSLIPLPLGRHVEGSELAAVLSTCRTSALVTVVAGKIHIESLPADAETITWPEPVPDFLKLTSGTTNLPRAVRFRWPQLVTDCDHICNAMGIGEDDLNYGVIPFSHSYGFSNLLTPLLCRGVALVATEDRLPRAILLGLQSSGATVFPGMPVFYDKLAGLPDPPALPALRLCISAGAPLIPAVAEAFTSRFGPRIHTFYGSSECGGIGYDAAEEGPYIAGYMGVPMPGVSVQPETADGSAGRIVIEGPAVGDGYIPETEDAALCGGRFTPGDLIRFDGGGMYSEGRSSDVINIAGRKLNPLEVEARVNSFPGLRQVIIFGVTSTLRGEEPVACVAGQGIDPARFLRFCRSQLSEWQVPRDVWVVPEIPANERGKVSRRQLAERYRVEKARG